MPLSFNTLLRLLVLLFFSTPLMAINVMPFSGELDLEIQPNYKLQVSNKGQNEAAVIISVYKWRFDRFGKEIREPTNDLVIFPKRILLAPNAKKSVRVSYRQGISPRNEKAYRIVVEEKPMPKSYRTSVRKGASINVLTRYVTAFYVKPRDANSSIKVLNAENYGNGFQLKIRNEGNAHTHFISPTMTIRQAGKKLVINDLSLLNPFTNSNIFAMADRVYEWDIPEGLRQTIDIDNPYRVELDWFCENCSGKKDKISFVVN